MAFLYPSFLYALAAVAVPVILHLVQLRRAKRVMFSNVKFIQASKDLTASQRNLKELLILLSRILFVVFLVLAFAQPFLPASQSTSVGDESEVGMVVDNSYSMQNLHENEDLSLLNVAIDRSKAVLRLFPSSSAITLASSERLNHGAPVQGAEAIGILDQLNFSAKPFIPATNNYTDLSHLFILSDFQKNSFSPTVLDAVADSSTQLHLVPLAAANSANITIDSVYLKDEFLRPGVENTLHVLLSNTGAEAVEDVPIKLFIQNEQASALSIDIPAKQSAEAVMAFSTIGEAARQAYVQVEDYPVEFDNTFYFVLKASAPIVVTEVSNGESTDLQRLYSHEPFFRYRSFTSGNIDYAALKASDIVIINGLDALSEALAATLASYVKDGGTLAVVPPANDNRGGYTSLFKSLNLTASFTGSGQAKTNLAAPDPKNPFFQNIFSEYDPKLQMPAAARKVAWSRASDDILKFRGGASFLSRFDRGTGHVYLMAAPLDEAFSTLPNHALFVPIMYRLAISSYKQSQQLSYSLSGETVQLPATNLTNKEGIYKLQHDTLAFIPQQQVRGGKLYFNVPPEMGEAGFYTLQLQDSVVATLAFNYGKEESYLEQYSPDELRALVGEGRPNIHVYDYGDAFSVKGEFEKRYFGVKLWKYCLILCLFFLMAEIALIRLL